MPSMTLQDGTIKFEDNAGAHSETVEFEQGNLTLNIPGYAPQFFLDRGKFGATPDVRRGDDQAITFSFTAYMRDMTHATEGILTDILTNGGYFASDWVSTLGSSSDVKTVKLTWTVSDPAGGSDHTLVLSFCHVSGSIAEGYPNQLTLNGTDFEVFPTSTT